MKIVIFCALLVICALEPVYAIHEYKTGLKSQIIGKILHDIVDGESSRNVRISADLKCISANEILNEFASFIESVSRSILITQNGRFSLARSHLILYCSTDELLKHHSNYAEQTFNLLATHKTFIYCPNLNIEFLSKLIDHIPSVHHFYLVENNDKILILRVTKHSEVHCKKALSIVNSFNISSKMWNVKNRKSIYMMQTNFKGCNITFGMDGVPHFLPTDIMSGLNQEVLMALGRKYNFISLLKIIENNEMNSVDHMIDTMFSVKTAKWLEHDDVSWPIESIQYFFLVSKNTKQLIDYEVSI